jgi:hypothetical protein
VKKSRYKKIAEEAYARVADGGEQFDLGEVIDEIVAELSSETTNAELVREFAETLAAGADDRASARIENQQMDLLTGEPVAMEAVWRLGAGRRVKARHAVREDVLAWLQIRAANAQRVADAFDADRKLAVELLLYMTDDETTVEKAVEARKKAQGGSTP